MIRRLSLTLVTLVLAVACKDDAPPPAEEHEHGGGGSAGASGSGARGGDDATGGAVSGRGGASSGTETGGTSGAETGGASSSGGSSAGGEPGEAGAGSDAGGGGQSGDGPVEPPVVNACTAYVDRTASDATTLTWDFSLEEAPERCLHVRVGQSVTWAGDLDFHPLEISPFAPGTASPAGDAYSVTFTQPGAWGYVCITHSEMNGGIWVTP